MQKFASLKSAKAFRVQIRGDGVLDMKDEENAWMEYSTHIRAGDISADMPDWIPSRNPFLNKLTGTLSSGSSVKATDLLGFEALFACGTRTDMHDPSASLGKAGDPVLKTSFVDCIKQGSKKNAQLKIDNPSA